MKRVQPAESGQYSHELLLLMAEQVKESLVAITQMANIDAERSSHEARRALKTIDNILLYHRVHAGQQRLLLEPVHVGSAIQSVAAQMTPLMKPLGCQTELHIQHGLSPIHVDRKLFEAALTSMWQGVLHSSSAASPIVCRAKKTTKGIRVSIHSDSIELDNFHLSGANINSLQPITAVAGPAADFLTAHGLFDLLGSGGISKSQHARQSGVGATLAASAQLQMV